MSAPENGPPVPKAPVAALVAALAAITAVWAGDGGGRADAPGQRADSEDGEKFSHRGNLP